MAIWIGKDIRYSDIEPPVLGTTVNVSPEKTDEFNALLTEERRKLSEKDTSQPIFRDYHTNEATMMTTMHESLAKRMRTDQIMKNDSYLRVSKI